MSSFKFSVVLFTLLACNADISLTATAPSPSPSSSPSPSPSSSPSPSPPTETNVAVDEIKITGVDLQSQLLPPVSASRATCGNFNIPKTTSTTPLAGSYVLVKVTPTSNVLPTPSGLNTCSPFNFMSDVCGATRVIIDDTFRITFSTFATNQKAPLVHYQQVVNPLAVDFPLYQSKVTSMQELDPSGHFVNIFPIPGQVTVTQDVPFAIITSDDDRAWIAFVTCSLNNPIAWVILKKDLIGNQQQFDAYQNAFNQALRFSGVNTSSMIDIPMSAYTSPSSPVSDARLSINMAALTTSSTTSATSSSPSPPPPPQ